MEDCLFCRICADKIPSRTIFEDDQARAFHDIQPAARVHFMIVPKRHIASLQHVGPDDSPLLGHLLTLVPKLAAQEGLKDGFRTRISTGPGGDQEVYHLHIHVLGGGPPEAP